MPSDLLLKLRAEAARQRWEASRSSGCKGGAKGKPYTGSSFDGLRGVVNIC